MAENIENILNYLKELGIATSFSVQIPSTNNIVTFKQLNTEQLRQLLETITSTATITNKFNTVFLKILKDNLLTEGTNIDDLTIYDIQYLALQMRVNSLSDKLTIYFTEEEIDAYQLPNASYELDLKEFINSKKLNVVPNELVTENNIQIICQVPTAKDEGAFLKHFTNNIETVLKKDLEDLVGEIFIYEIVKSIKQITTNETTIIFENLSFTDRAEIVKQLPTSLTGKIITYIEKYKQALYNLYLVNIDVQAQNTSFTLQKELQYSATLFNY